MASLREKLRAGEKSLVGNKGYRRYLCCDGAGSLPDRRGEDRGGGPLRRQVGAADQHRPGRGRGGVAVQAALDGGGLVPLVQVAVADPADLPQVRRDDPGPRVLLVPGVGAAPGAGGAAGRGGVTSSSGPT